VEAIRLKPDLANQGANNLLPLLLLTQHNGGTDQIRNAVLLAALLGGQLQAGNLLGAGANQSASPAAPSPAAALNQPAAAAADEKSEDE
jgi:hypothetical protein